jgi:hypothetical protein
VPFLTELLDGAAGGGAEQALLAMSHRAGSTCWPTSSARL